MQHKECPHDEQALNAVFERLYEATSPGITSVTIQFKGTAKELRAIKESIKQAASPLPPQTP